MSLVTLYDITPPISGKLTVWPGDTGPSREVLCDMARGDNITLSTLRATVHLGAHADGPNHYGKDAPAIDERSLDYYLGPCQVIRVGVARATRIVPSMLPREVTAPRVLFATGTYPDPQNWNADFAALSVELIDFLHEHGVIADVVPERFVAEGLVEALADVPVTRALVARAAEAREVVRYSLEDYRRRFEGAGP